MEKLARSGLVQPPRTCLLVSPSPPFTPRPVFIRVWTVDDRLDSVCRAGSESLLKYARRIWKTAGKGHSCCVFPEDRHECWKHGKIVKSTCGRNYIPTEVSAHGDQCEKLFSGRNITQKGQLGALQLMLLLSGTPCDGTRQCHIPVTCTQAPPCTPSFFSVMLTIA